MRALAVLLGIVMTGALQAQGTATVSGVVHDEVGAPVREALVVIDPDSLRIRARTNDAGRFTMPGVPAGRYEVRVLRIGYRPQSRMIDVTGREVSLEF
jgi:protocatechuate 3,4-dioxygenase beta subunit